jgi:hypothetical protein
MLTEDLWQVLITINWGLIFGGVDWVLDRSQRFISLSRLQRQIQLCTISEPFWAWGMTFIKISVAFMFLRVQRGTGWRRFLYGLIIFHIFLGLFAVIFQLLQCIPFSAAWKFPRPTGSKCFSDKMNDAAAFTVAAINSAADILFSLIPISFLRKIRRPVGERVIVGALMGLGLLASAASIAKALALADLTKTIAAGQDVEPPGVNVVLWTCLEEQFGFLAACLPCLKSLLQSSLVRLSILPDQNARLPKANTGISDSYRASTTINSLRTKTSCFASNRTRCRTDRISIPSPIRHRNYSPTSLTSPCYPSEEALYVSETGRIMCRTNVYFDEEHAMDRDLRRDTPRSDESLDVDHYRPEYVDLEAVHPFNAQNFNLQEPGMTYTR